MKDRHSLLDSVLGAFVPIHPDGYKFVFGAALATLLLFALAPPLGWLAAIATAWCAYFFRDPDRVTPSREGLVVSAADGRIVATARAVPARASTRDRTAHARFRVPVDFRRAYRPRPVGGRMVRSIYVPGRF